MNRTLQRSIKTAACAVLILACTPLFAHGDSHEPRGKQEKAKPSPLVEKVRNVTNRYRDINVAITEGWVQATPCVSGPNAGAMGVHFVLPERVGDGVLRSDQPEALIYEPLPGGRMRLVGVEFIVIAEHWDTRNPEAQPNLDGHLLNLVGAPNRYRLPAFYELHVWAWEHNPDGHFADWNKLVTCDMQRAD